jgi:hypothetical protein
MFRDAWARGLVSLFILLLLAASSSITTTVRASPPATGTYTAASCNRGDVNAVINGPTHTAIDGDVIQIPSGTCIWTNGIVVPTGIGISIIGAGTTDPHNPSGDGTNTTTIIDNYTGSFLFFFTPSYGASTTRLSSVYLSPQSGLSANSMNAPIAVQGTCATGGCPNFRLDHIVIPGSPSWGGLVAQSSTLVITDNVFGVLDHNSLYHSSGPLYEFVNFNHSAWQGIGHYGDNSWASPDSFGTAQALYVETNYIEETSSSALFPLTEAEAGFGPNQQGEGGGRIVCRFNTAVGIRSMCVNHGTESNGRPRGGRQMEFYKNTMNCPSSSYPSCWNNGMLFGAGPRSGSLLSIANSFTGKGMNTFASIAYFRDTGSFVPFGPCDGTGPYDNNDPTLYASGTVTSLSGSWTITDNTKSWTANQWAAGSVVYSFHDVTTGDGSEILSNGTNTLSVPASPFSNNFRVGDSYQIRRAITCLDQSSRIGGSLLSGATTLTPTNSSAGWMNQTLDPIYEAADTNDQGDPSFGPFGGSARIIANRDYYAEVSQSAQTSQTSPFNGSVGTGYGTLANRPSTCTPSVGYWATDQGNWNNSGSGGQGQLFVCTATNTWTPYYTPYTYPHPLTNSTSTQSTAPAITTQPMPQTITGGSTATLTVVAAGTAPLSYQWYQGPSGTPVGTNLSSFTTPALTATTSYWVTVTNSLGSVSSAAATITVNTATPTITTQPASQTIASAATATLNVVASGPAPLSYQWYQGSSGDTSTPVGTNSTSFTTPALTTNTNYWVQITNSGGSVNSATATITVNAAGAPVISISAPSSGATVSGTVSISATVSGASITGVQFVVDNVNYGAQITTPPYTVLWNTSGVPNASHTLSAVALNSANLQGTAPAITVIVSNAPPTQNFTIPAGGGISFETVSPSASSSTVSHALVQTASASGGTSGTGPVANQSFDSLGIAGVSMIGLRTNGVLVTEGGVPASEELNSGRIYAENHDLVRTGIALSNLTSTDAVVSYYFTDDSGNDIGQGSMQLQSDHQFAAFLDQPPFNAPQMQQGSFTFFSSGPVGAIALRNVINDRQENLFTTLPVTSLDGRAASTVIPHFVDGPGWTTDVVLTNASENVEAGTMQYFGQGSGASTTPPLSLTVNGISGSAFNYSLKPHSSARFSTAGTSANVQVGSVVVTSGLGIAGSSDAPIALSIIENRNGGILVSETSVPAAPNGTAFRVYMEAGGTNGQAGSIDSGLAVANSSSNVAIVSVDLTNLDGAPAGVAPATRSVPPGGQIAAFLDDLFPGLPTPFQGIARVTTNSTPVAVACLRGRYNERQDFLMTTTPPLNETVAGSGSLVFPHIVSGGGFTTQLVLFGGQETATLSLYNTDGSPESTSIIQ